MTLRSRILAAEATALCVMRKWWRPVTCVWIAGTMAVHGVVLPVLVFVRTGQLGTDLTGLSLLVTATAGAFAVREWGKIKGTADAE